MPSYNAKSGPPPWVEAGDYPFEVVDAKETTAAKTGNPMIDLTLEVAGGTRVFDHLVFYKTSIWKIDQFRESTGEDVEEGECDLEAEDCVGRTGLVQLKVGQSNTGKTRNEVVQYLPPVRKTKTVTAAPAKTGPATTAKAADLVPDDSDIPFRTTIYKDVSTSRLNRRIF